MRRTTSPTFNRTSMESKLAGNMDEFTEILSFNRTSMESKPPFTDTFFVDYIELLIEPVWNRNPRGGGGAFCFYHF